MSAFNIQEGIKAIFMNFELGLNLNDTELYDLTDGIDQFSNIPALRQEYGADLVSLLCPFTSQHKKIVELPG